MGNKTHSQSIRMRHGAKPKGQKRNSNQYFFFYISVEWLDILRQWCKKNKHTSAVHLSIFERLPAVILWQIILFVIMRWQMSFHVQFIVSVGRARVASLDAIVNIQVCVTPLNRIVSIHGPCKKLHQPQQQRKNQCKRKRRRWNSKYT